jgi:hypothetical protein
LADIIADYFPAILAMIAVVIAPLLIYFSRQNTTSIMGTIKLETYSKSLEKLEEDQNKNFSTLSDKLDHIIRKQDNHGWRLEQVEKELVEIREKKIGALEQELAQIHNHKARIRQIEQDLQELKMYRAKNGGDRASV